MDGMDGMDRMEGEDAGGTPAIPGGDKGRGKKQARRPRYEKRQAGRPRYFKKDGERRWR